MAKRKSKIEWQDRRSLGAETTLAKVFRVKVHRWIDADPGQWFVTCHVLGIDRNSIGDPGIGIDEAKRLAVQHVVDHINNVARLLAPYWDGG